MIGWKVFPHAEDQRTYSVLVSVLVLWLRMRLFEYEEKMPKSRKAPIKSMVS